MAGEPAATVAISVDGVAHRVTPGISVAAALLDAGIWSFRTSVQGGARAPLCGMGTCWECRVAIDGVPHRRACLAPVADGMTVRTGGDAAP